MREWIASTRDTQSCGGCGARIPKGIPMLAIRMHGMLRSLVRCATCANVPMPEQIPDPVMPEMASDPQEARARAVAQVVEQCDLRLKPPAKERPAFVPRLVPVDDRWSPFRDGGE